MVCVSAISNHPTQYKVLLIPPHSYLRIFVNIADLTLLYRWLDSVCTEPWQRHTIPTLKTKLLAVCLLYYTSYLQYFCYCVDHRRTEYKPTLPGTVLFVRTVDPHQNSSSLLTNPLWVPLLLHRSLTVPLREISYLRHDSQDVCLAARARFQFIQTDRI